MPLITIAIDGPSGAGKSTVARRVAAELGYAYIDTGAMYRAVALRALKQGVSVENEADCVVVAEEADIAFQPSGAGQLVLLDGEDVSEAIRTMAVTQLSSPMSAISGVRRVLVARQQAMGQAGGVVMEGRDIGTVVFPHAEVKIFLTAEEEERARRRQKDLQRAGREVSLEEVIAMQRERDERDSSREDSPLIAADDAVYIDSNPMNEDEVVAQVLRLAHERSAS
jgi:cytidylate kinase